MLPSVHVLVLWFSCLLILSGISTPWRFMALSPGFICMTCRPSFPMRSRPTIEGPFPPMILTFALVFQPFDANFTSTFPSKLFRLLLQSRNTSSSLFFNFKLRPILPNVFFKSSIVSKNIGGPLSIQLIIVCALLLIFSLGPATFNSVSILRRIAISILSSQALQWPSMIPFHKSYGSSVLWADFIQRDILSSNVYFPWISFTECHPLKNRVPLHFLSYWSNLLPSQFFFPVYPDFRVANSPISRRNTPNYPFTS